MIKAIETKDRVLNIGMQLVLFEGYHNTGLNEIIKAADISKGTFYHYFESKEAFALELIDHYTNTTEEIMSQDINKEDVSPLESLKKIFLNKIALQQSLHYKRGCLVGNFSIEMSNLSKTVQEKTEESLIQFSSVFKTFLDAAKDKGEIAEEMDTEETASFIINSWQGAMLRMKSAKSVKPLKTFYNYTFNILLKPL